MTCQCSVLNKIAIKMRVTRERTEWRTGETTTETVYALTSVSAERAGPEQLLAWSRGHWMVENKPS